MNVNVKSLKPQRCFCPAVLVAVLLCCALVERAEAQSAEARKLQQAQQQATRPSWTNNWVEFSALAERYITENLQDAGKYASQGLLFSIPDTVGQSVVWTGIFNRYWVTPVEANDPITHNVVVKFYPAVRARIAQCLVVGDQVTMSVPEPQLAEWKRLKPGMAVKVSATLGIQNAVKTATPVGGTAFLFRSRQPEQCELGLVLEDVSLIEAW